MSLESYKSRKSRRITAVSEDGLAGAILDDLLDHAGIEAVGHGVLEGVGLQL